MIDFDRYEVVTFDCYGTLIDWEHGILAALNPILLNHAINLPDEEVLQHFAAIEMKEMRGRFVPYREVLVRTMRGLGRQLSFEPTLEELNVLLDSLPLWIPFTDSVDALQQLKKRYKIAVISNIDNDLFVSSEMQLMVDFDHIVTSEDVQAYKPSLRVFEHAMEQMRVHPSHVLHVAQSLYHDIMPAKTIGLNTIWVNRRIGRSGSGATPHAAVQPDASVPDLDRLITAAQLKEA